MKKKLINIIILLIVIISFTSVAVVARDTAFTKLGGVIEKVFASSTFDSLLTGSPSTSALAYGRFILALLTFSIAFSLLGVVGTFSRNIRITISIVFALLTTLALPGSIIAAIFGLYSGVFAFLMMAILIAIVLWVIYKIDSFIDNPRSAHALKALFWGVLAWVLSAFSGMAVNGFDANAGLSLFGIGGSGSISILIDFFIMASLISYAMAIIHFFRALFGSSNASSSSVLPSGFFGKIGDFFSKGPGGSDGGKNIDEEIKEEERVEKEVKHSETIVENLIVEEKNKETEVEKSLDSAQAAYYVTETVINNIHNGDSNQAISNSEHLEQTESIIQNFAQDLNETNVKINVQSELLMNIIKKIDEAEKTHPNPDDSKYQELIISVREEVKRLEQIIIELRKEESNNTNIEKNLRKELNSVKKLIIKLKKQLEKGQNEKAESTSINIKNIFTIIINILKKDRGEESKIKKLFIAIEYDLSNVYKLIMKELLSDKQLKIEYKRDSQESIKLIEDMSSEIKLLPPVIIRSEHARLMLVDLRRNIKQYFIESNAVDQKILTDMTHAQKLLEDASAGNVKLLDDPRGAQKSITGKKALELEYFNHTLITQLQDDIVNEEKIIKENIISQKQLIGTLKEILRDHKLLINGPVVRIVNTLNSLKALSGVTYIFYKGYLTKLSVILNKLRSFEKVIIDNEEGLQSIENNLSGFDLELESQIKSAHEFIGKLTIHNSSIFYNNFEPHIKRFIKIKKASLKDIRIEDKDIETLIEYITAQEIEFKRLKREFEEMLLKAKTYFNSTGKKAT